MESGFLYAGKVDIRRKVESDGHCDIVYGLYRKFQIAESGKYFVFSAYQPEYRADQVCHIEYAADGVVQRDFGIELEFPGIFFQRMIIIREMLQNG